MKLRLSLLALPLMAVLFSFSTFAQKQVGVGVGLGLIRLHEPLTPGGVYKLPSIPVINTGEVESEYEVVAANTRPGLFTFSPARFTLAPGETQNAAVHLNLPFDAPAGDYLVYLEAHPLQSEQSGQVAIGVAAATKLFYSVGQSPSVLGALKQRVLTLWRLYLPWSLIFVLLLDFLLIFFLLRSLISLKITLRLPKKPRKKPQSDNILNPSG